MKTSIVYLIMGLLVINSLSAQVKIGDNPQNLDPSSILELQSTNRVLVITRVTDAQMSVINPLPGAVVYNTDQECLHYYNGTEWINICEALDNSFTTSTRADSLRQIDPNARDNTIIITETTNPDESINYNFEVNRITGANIETGAVNGDKIQGSVVDTRHIVNQAVTFGKLQSGTNEGDLFMWNGSSWNFVNRSDLLNTQLDSIVGNEVKNATQNGSLERFGLGTQDDPYTLDVADGGIDTAELADDAVTTLKILDGNVTNAKLDKGNIPLSGFGAAEDNVDLDGNKLINLADPIAPLDAVNLQYLEGAIAASNQVIVSTDNPNSITTGSDGGALYDDTALENAVSDNANDIADNTTAIGTKEDSANKSTNVTLGTSDDLFPTQNAVKTYVDTEIAASEQTIVSTDAPNSITEGTDGGALYDDSALQTAVSDNADDIADNTTAIGEINTLPDANIYVGDATNTAQEVTVGGDATMNNLGELTIEAEAVTPAKIEPSPSTTDGQVLTTLGGNVSWQSPLTSTVIAMGQVDAPATSEIMSGLATDVIRNSQGNYTVSLNLGPTANYIVQLTIDSTNTRIIQMANRSATEFDVLIFDEDGNSQDSAWQFMVIQFTP